MRRFGVNHGSTEKSSNQDIISRGPAGDGQIPGETSSTAKRPIPVRGAAEAIATPEGEITIMGSKIRMTLAALTAVALVGGLMAADPADAGKKRKHHKKSVKISQNARGGDARGGNGGHGGNGGNAFNFGGAGTPGTPATGPGVGVTPANVACLLPLGPSPGGIVAAAPFGPAEFEAAVEAALEGACGPLPEAFTDCVIAGGTVAGAVIVIDDADIVACLEVVPGTPGTVGGGGAIGGAGGAGAPGGAAHAGNGGANVINVENDDD
jgi:hypothetical protein